MPLPQDIRPVFQNIQDTLVRSDAPWIERSPNDKLKVLWIGPETGTWAALHHWKKGYAAPPHKHLAGAHVFILSGKLQIRDGTLNAGDYIYEPSKEELLTRLWGIGPGEVETRTIDMHIARLRTKLKDPSGRTAPEAIVTVRAQGYMAGPVWKSGRQI